MRIAFVHSLLRRSPAAFCVGLAALAPHAAEPQNPAHVVPLERPDLPLDAPAPPSRFIVPDGEQLWRKARQRATEATADHGGGYIDPSMLVGEGFRSAKKFHAEKYAENESGSALQFAIAADEAVKNGRAISLTRMRLVYFINNAPAPVAKTEQPRDKQAAAGQAKQPPGAKGARPPKAKKDPAALAGKLPAEGRVVITAPEAVIDTATNEGRASGKVTIEIFAQQHSAAAGKTGDEQPVAVLSSERLRWRTWSEPQFGSTELAVAICSETEGEPEPLVSVRYVMPQADGAAVTMEMTGRGMIYEAGSFDRLTPVEDEEGRTAGLNKTVRNRAIFHHDIKLVTTATAMIALMPFQAGGTPAEKQRPRQPAAEPPSQTELFCKGPAVINLASVPRAKGGEDAELAPIQPARRFEFLNSVSMTKKPLASPGDSPPAGDASTHMACRHLCLQYAPGAMPGPATLPEYGEAIGGVTMRGFKSQTPQPGAPSAAPSPFNIACGRIYFDGGSDSLFLAGDATAPMVTVQDEKGDVTAQQFCYRNRTQTLTMPSTGAKRMVLKASTAAAGAAGTEGVLNLGAAETIIAFNGPLSRELRHLPVPGKPDRIKEILTLEDDVRIEQPGRLSMRGQTIRVVSAMPERAVEFLEGIGAVDVAMGELKARGEMVSVDMDYGPAGEIQKNVITIIGDRAKGGDALLFMGGSAVRAEKFIIDRKNDTFRAFGGAVAVIKAAGGTPPAQPKPQEAKDAGALFPGISFSTGGNLFVQCDGDFSQDGATSRVVVQKNVIIRQSDPERQLLADEVILTLEEPPAAAAPAAAATPAERLFAGKLKSLECRGNVEIATPVQLVHCDRLVYDAPSDSSVLQVDDPDNDVRIYVADGSGTRILSARKSLKLDGQSGAFTPGGPLVLLPYRASAPAPRDAQSSPARQKAPRTQPEGAKQQ